MHTHIHRCFWSLPGLKSLFYLCPHPALAKKPISKCNQIFPGSSCLLTHQSTRSSLAVHSLMGRILRNMLKGLQWSDMVVYKPAASKQYWSLLSPRYPWFFLHIPSLIHFFDPPFKHCIWSYIHPAIPVTSDNFGLSCETHSANPRQFCFLTKGLDEPLKDFT